VGLERAGHRHGARSTPAGRGSSGRAACGRGGPLPGA
jgi:hypothetical protein